MQSNMQLSICPKASRQLPGLTLLMLWKPKIHAPGCLSLQVNCGAQWVQELNRFSIKSKQERFLEDQSGWWFVSWFVNIRKRTTCSIICLLWGTVVLLVILHENVKGADEVTLGFFFSFEGANKTCTVSFVRVIITWGCLISFRAKMSGISCNNLHMLQSVFTPQGQ